MDFSLTDEQRQFAETVARLAQRHLTAGALARAHAPEYPWDVAKRLAETTL